MSSTPSCRWIEPRMSDDLIRLTVTGGADLRVKWNAKGRALAFLRVVNQ